jgi:hypothetical protein
LGKLATEQGRKPQPGWEGGVNVGAGMRLRKSVHPDPHRSLVNGEAAAFSTENQRVNADCASAGDIDGQRTMPLGRNRPESSPSQAFE